MASTSHCWNALGSDGISVSRPRSAAHLSRSVSFSGTAPAAASLARPSMSTRPMSRTSSKTGQDPVQISGTFVAERPTGPADPEPGDRLVRRARAAARLSSISREVADRCTPSSVANGAGIAGSRSLPRFASADCPLIALITRPVSPPGGGPRLRRGPLRVVWPMRRLIWSRCGQVFATWPATIPWRTAGVRPSTPRAWSMENCTHPPPRPRGTRGWDDPFGMRREYPQAPRRRGSAAISDPATRSCWRSPGPRRAPGGSGRRCPRWCAGASSACRCRQTCCRQTPSG